MAVYAHQCLNDECDEAQIVHRGLSRAVQQYAGIGAEAPVVVLAGAVDACKRLLVQQYAESVLSRHTLHQRHQEHVVVYGQVAFLVYRGQFKLVGRYLVVTCLARYGQLESSYFEIFHESLHTVGDGSEVMVVHLLVLGRVMSHQCAAGEQQVGAGRIESLVYEKILLFPSQIALYFLYVGVEVPADVGGGHVHSVQRAQQRCLVVECLARI